MTKTNKTTLPTFGSKLGTSAFGSWALILTVAALGGCFAGCAAQLGGERGVAGDESYLTWEEFLDTVYLEPWEGGVYIVNGDEPVENIEALRAYYDRMMGLDHAEGALIVHRSGNADAKWSDSQKHSLTYCVSTSFGSRHGQAVAAMEQAAEAWEAVADVDFIHVSAEDGNCTSRNTNVLFDVNPASGQDYLARAFFPDQGRSSRNVIIDSSSWTVGAPWTVEGILRHELGHTLGFRHEHTRPEAGTCYEDNSWRPLTPYDGSSVMHYPHCNGSQTGDLVITAQDAIGASSLYGSPTGGGTEPEPPPAPGGEQTGTTSDSVTQGQFRHYAPLTNLAPGSTLTVTMTGSGDPDLYVRFGSQPTTSAYDCRPYRSGASESCTLTVPAAGADAYISVRGYTAASYTLTYRFTQAAPPAPPPSADPIAKSGTASGSVTRGNWVHYEPLTNLAGGTELRVEMTGNGDGDLYVRFGGQPTASAFDCRPYAGNSNEVCTLTVPSDGATAYFSVNGYSSTTVNFNINVRWYELP